MTAGAMAASAAALTAYRTIGTPATQWSALGFEERIRVPLPPAIRMAVQPSITTLARRVACPHPGTASERRVLSTL